MYERLKLYDAQNEGVQRFLSAPGHRIILAYGTGVGKTPTAITALVSHLKRENHTLDSEAPPRILVCCPAIVRRHWTREFGRWAHLRAECIEMGRHRKSGTKKALAARDVAYAWPIQIVSYDLAGEVDPGGWEFIVFDEIHHLSDCTSRQSRVARALMLNNPDVPCIGLSATLIPTELPQLWHPLYLLFGEDWGRFPRAGKICWEFVGRYCDIVRNEYGSTPGKPLQRKLPELKKRLAEVTHRLSREDIADDLPPIDCSVLDVPGDNLHRSVHLVGTRPFMRPEVKHATDWYAALEPDITHAVVLCYHRDVATALAAGISSLLKPETLLAQIDGSMGTAERVQRLEVLEASPSAVLIATSESLREGVRLMWPQKVLFAEWRQSPAQVVQVLGRFYSVGDKRRPQIQILSDESLFSQAQRLLERMAACNQLITAGHSEAVVEKLFAPKELTPSRMADLTKTMLAMTPKGLDSEWHDTEGEDDDW